MFFSEGYQFGKLLEQERIAQNMTQEALGEGFYTSALICKIENGKFYPPRFIRNRLLE